LQYFSRLKETGVLSMRSCMAPLRVLARRGDYQQCVEVLELLEKNNCVIDNIVLNVVLHACVTANRFALAQQVFEHRRHLADVVSYNTMLKGVVNSHTTYGVARALFDEMMQRGLSPTSITFNTLMNAAVREGKTAAESFKILAEMQKLNDPSVQPDKYTCSILVRGLITHRGSLVWQKEKLKILLDIVGTLGCLDGLGLKPSFCRTILNLCAVADPAMALKAVQQFVSQRAAPVEQLYQALMTAHAGQRRAHECWEAWNHMLEQNSGVKPAKGHFLALFDASVAKDQEFTKQAVELMYEAGVTLQPHRVLSALRILLAMGAYDTALLVCQDQTVRTSLSDVVKAIEERRLDDAAKLVQPHNNNNTSTSQHMYEQKNGGKLQHGQQPYRPPVRAA